MATGFEEKNLEERVTHLREPDTVDHKHISVQLLDFDDSIKYFIENIISPTVMENGAQIKVPTLYGSPERWNAATKEGYIRDTNGKIILPLLMYRRTGIAQNEDLIFPRYFNNVLYMNVAGSWDKNNRYDHNAIVNGRKKTESKTVVAVPNYVNVTYEAQIWTSFVEQMNLVIEKLTYANNAFWGDDSKYKFRIYMDSFDNSIDVSTDSERIVKTTFNINLMGYLLPESFNNKMTSQQVLTPNKVFINMRERIVK
jgi:hypothetical protein